MIYCKVELKLKLTKKCVLQATGVHIVNAHDNNIIFTVKDTRLYVNVVTLSAKNNQTLSKRLHKKFERSDYRNEYRKGRMKKRKKNGYRYFLNQTS